MTAITSRTGDGVGGAGVCVGGGDGETVKVGLGLGDFDGVGDGEVTLVGVALGEEIAGGGVAAFARGACDVGRALKRNVTIEKSAMMKTTLRGV